MTIRKTLIDSRFRRITFFLAAISLIAGLVPAFAQDVYLCVWRNPERTMKKLFPDARGYLTMETGISDEQREEIESKLGFELVPGQRDRFLYFTMTGADGAGIGTVIAASQKGQYGAIEFIVGLDNELVIRDLYFQRAREKDRRFKKREFLDLFVGQALSEVEDLHLLYEGEETPGTTAVIRGLQKELVSYEVVVLKAHPDTE